MCHFLTCKFGRADKRKAAYNYILNNVRPTRSRFIWYPRGFTTTAGVNFTQGAVISIGPNSIQSSFASITDSSSINLLDSKALYDTKCVSPPR